MLKGLLCMAAAGALASCSDGAGWGEKPASGTGKIALAADLDASVTSSRSSRAEYSDVLASDLALKLTDASGKVHAWKSVADFPVDSAFAVGSYTLEAYYGDESTEGFEAPYFYGKQELVVKDQQTTPVALTATLANSMVEIVYTDDFKNYMTSYSAKVHSAGGAYTDYAASETRPVYTQAGNVTVSVDFVKPNGNGATIEVASFTAKPKTLHRLTVDLGGDGVGTATIEVTFDETLEEETVEIDISDEVLNAPAPTVEAEGFTSGESIDFVAGIASASSLKTNIIARGGLTGVTLTTVSQSLLAQGWPAEIDLIGATTDQQNTLRNLGLSARGVFKNPEKLAVLDFTDVLKHIAYQESGSNETQITVVAKDTYGKLSEPVTLTLAALNVELTLDNGTIYVGDNKLSVDVHYNGGNPDGDLSITYDNIRGTKSPFNFTLTDLGNGVYRASGTINDAADPIVLHATIGSLTTDCTINRISLDITPTTTANGTFATNAYISCAIDTQGADVNTETIFKSAKAYVSTDGTNYTAVPTEFVSGNVVRATGLTPATTYSVKVMAGNGDLSALPAATITTEAAATLYNSDMEKWYNAPGKSSKYSISYAGEDANTIWSSMNLLTTSEGGSNTTATSTNKDGFPYNAISGTIGAAGRNGQAALIRTVGWGKGNNAVANGNFITPMKCNHVTAGELFLGTYEGAPSYGTAFTSRPSAITFYYKYAPKNVADDYALAEAIVYDADGNEVARDAFQISGTSSDYIKHTLNLGYTAQSNKAAKLSLRFVSSANAACVNTDASNLTRPSYASEEPYMGSQLYIDDIELTY